MWSVKRGIRKQSTANLRNPHIQSLSIKDELKQLWADANEQGLTLDAATNLLKAKGFGEWGTSTVRDTVNGKGKDIRELVLRKVLLEHLGRADSVKDGRADSAKAQVETGEESTEYRTANEWKSEALNLRSEVKRLKAALHLMTTPDAPLSSNSSELMDRFLLELAKLSKAQSRGRDTGESGQRTGS